jgi:hypothetical protein
VLVKSGSIHSLLSTVVSIDMGDVKCLSALFLFFSLASASYVGEPESALPALQYDYVPKGEFSQIGDLPLYVAKSANPDPGRFVVWAYDVFGWVSPGRGFEMVDLLAETTGITVVMPDFMRGEEKPEPETYEWETQMKVRGTIDLGTENGLLTRWTYQYKFNHQSQAMFC